MKKGVSILLAICLVLTCMGCQTSTITNVHDSSTPFVVEQTEESKVNIQSDETVVMVWIPRTGKRYHRNPRCSGMKKPTNVSLLEAERRGYTPCGNCY